MKNNHIPFTADEFSTIRVPSELVNRVNEDDDFSNAADSANNVFFEAVKDAVQKSSEAGYTIQFASAIENIFFETPRYAYIKHICINGADCEAQIDLLLRKISVN